MVNGQSTIVLLTSWKKSDTSIPPPFSQITDFDPWSFYFANFSITKQEDVRLWD